MQLGLEAIEVAYKLSTTAILAKPPILVLITHMELTTACNSSSKASDSPRPTKALVHTWST